MSNTVYQTQQLVLNSTQSTENSITHRVITHLGKSMRIEMTVEEKHPRNLAWPLKNKYGM
jgi:hypothetical protein